MTDTDLPLAFTTTPLERALLEAHAAVAHLESARDATGAEHLNHLSDAKARLERSMGLIHQVMVPPGKARLVVRAKRGGFSLTGTDGYSRFINSWFKSEEIARREKAARALDPDHKISFEGDA